MAKDTELATPKCAPSHLNYEKECREVLAPFVSDILDRAENAGWNRKRVASALMYLAAMEIKPND